MKCCAILALLAVYAYGAPTGNFAGSFNANPNGASGSLSANAGGVSGSMGSSVNSPPFGSYEGTGVNALNGFKAILELFAPESWITAFNSTSQDGQVCFMKAAGDPANQAVWSGNDVEAMKKVLQDKCPDQATQLGAFIDASAATYKSLPDSFVQLATDWGNAMQSLGEKIKQTAASNPGVRGQDKAALYKPIFAEFSTDTANFLQKTAELSDADRQQISTAFPKLQPFFSGDQAVNFLKQAAAIYQTLGSGNIDTNALQTQGQQLQSTLMTIWQQYTTQNAAGLQKAKELGVDLTNISAYMKSQADAPNGFNNFAASHPELAHLMSSASNENAKEQFSKAENNMKEGANSIKNKLNGAPDSASVNVAVQ